MVIQKPFGNLFLVLTGWMILAGMSVGSGVLAQVIPDKTLPAGERSQVSGNSTVQIDGGARRGNNLFHSFQSFSIPTGGAAFFNNAPNIQNILTRVTGSSISNIDGLIRANGTANLFLLNPNGIIFGPNARLNIGGSFLASTANSIDFANGFQFSASNPQAPPLLTISVPIGLQLGQNPGSITVQGSGYDLSVAEPIFSPITRGSSSSGLRVTPGKTLALVGGNIDLQGATLTAEQGHIELGSVGSGQVSLSSIPQGFALGYQGSQSFRDLRLTQQALLNASGGGSIQVQGNHVTLADGSLFWIQNIEEQAGGSISVKATNLLTASGSSPDGSFLGGLLSETLGTGSGADVAISTPQLIVRDGAGVTAQSYSSGKTGSVTVNAADTVQVVGFSPINPALNSLIGAVAFSSGDTGNVTVSTRRLTVLNGGGIATETLLDVGRAGDLTVNATDSIEVIGAEKTFTRVSNLAAISGGAGDAGKLTINTSRLVVQDGGAVSTVTYGTGNAGNLTINARDSIEISGKAQSFPFLSYAGASAVVDPDSVQQTLKRQAPREVQDLLPSGASGDTTINTGRLSVTNGASVDVSNQGTGNAGTLRIQANSIFLDNTGGITAATASGEGGNIQLSVRDSLLLRHYSGVTTSAGGNGNGGNININTPLLVALPNENSDISANSINARGGNVIISTNGLFGIQFRRQATALSEITATGANSALNGTVQLNVERIDPTRGLTQLPTGLVDASRLIAKGCRDVQGSSFVVTGRGGLPPNPQQALSNDPLWRDWRIPAVVNRQQNAHSVSVVPSGNPPTTQPTSSSTLVEATGWVIEPNGSVTLTATAPTVTSYQAWTPRASCN